MVGADSPFGNGAYGRFARSYSAELFAPRSASNDLLDNGISAKSVFFTSGGSLGSAEDAPCGEERVPASSFFAMRANLSSGVRPITAVFHGAQALSLSRCQLSVPETEKKIVPIASGVWFSLECDNVSRRGASALHDSHDATARVFVGDTARLVRVDLLRATVWVRRAFHRSGVRIFLPTVDGTTKMANPAFE